MRSGFVALAGRPNAGKSTLINALVGEKIAIVSEKAQTTRSEIRGIYTSEDCQIVFTDTPGIHKPKDRLGSRMNKESTDVIQGVDVIFLVVDGSVPYSTGDVFVLNTVKNAHLPVFLIMNKVDNMDKEEIIKNLNSWQERYDFAEYFPLSAKFDRTFDDLIATTAKYLPEGGLLYPAEMISDGAENFRIAEMIREKVLLCCEQEVPHATAVTIEEKEYTSKGCNIHATILVEKDGQKGILIGKGGTMLKRIGTMARKDIEKLLGVHVFLTLYVRKEEDWRSKDARISEYGYGGTFRNE